MPDARYLDSLVSRRVQYRYRRTTFAFDLSQSLFSSAAVDSGTHLLLATIAEELDLPAYDRFVDIGSGTGTLGIALAGSSARPLDAVDRDALALAFTRRNAELNGLTEFATDQVVTVPEYPGEGKELVVSNLPAKAGDPVLRFLIAAIARRASLAGGEAAIVIVRPLADFLAGELRSHAATIIAERRTANHASVLFRCPIPPEDAISEESDGVWHLPDAFIRHAVRFEGPIGPYDARTVYNLPDFDRMSFRTALAFDLLRGTNLTGSVLLYGCGQGHLLLGLAQRSGKSRLSIADRDLLALEITRLNATANGIALEDSTSVPTIASLADEYTPDSVDWLVIDDDPTPGSLWNAEVAAAADALLSDSGRLFLVSRSTSISRFEREMRSSFAQISDRRMHGFRASVLRPRR